MIQGKRSSNLRISRNVQQVCSLKYETTREAFSEKNRSHHQAIQARRGERSAPGSRIAGHYGHRGQGLRTAEGSRRTLSRLLLRKTFNNTQEKEVANYIFRLSEKLEDIEERLKFKGIIKAEENL